MRNFAFATACGLSLITGAVANKDAITLITNGNSWIREAVATLVVPELPASVTGDIALWSAIMMDDYKGDFLQGVTSSSPSGSYCEQSGGEWCNFAYKLKSGSAKAGNALFAQPGSRVRTHYKLNPATGYWDQNVYINNVLKSSISTSHGQQGNYFFVSIECASGKCANTPEHSWEDISLVLNQPDPSFGNAGAWKFGATGGEMTTDDNGRTWNFTTLYVPETPIALSR